MNSERSRPVKTATRALVPVPRTTDDGPLTDPRRSDVDEWGRSEHMREIARRLYDPLYRNWFRVEWEGLEKIPDKGGALLVSNHAGAIPSDAPVIMHGIETELGRPVYGLAESSVALTFPRPGDRHKHVAVDRAALAAGWVERGNSTTLVSVGRAIPGHEVRVVDYH